MLVIMAAGFAIAGELEEAKNQRIVILAQIKKTIDERTAKEESISESKSIIEQLDENISSIRIMNEELNGEYSDLLIELERLRRTIINAQSYLDKAGENAKEIILRMYKDSKSINDTVAGDSGNILDLFRSLNYVNIIVGADLQKIADAITTLDKLYLQESDLIDQIRGKNSEIRDINERLYSLSVSRSSAQRELRLTLDEINDLEKRKSELEEYSNELISEIKQLQKNSSNYVGGTMLWPVPSSSRVVSKFGYRVHPVYKDWRMHKGIDIAAGTKRNIVAANDGIVISSGYITGYGYTVVIDHGGGISTLYAHCSKLLVKSGDLVFKGDLIALIGSSGVSTGPHLHFEVRVNGVQKNPLNYFK